MKIRSCARLPSVYPPSRRLGIAALALPAVAAPPPPIIRRPRAGRPHGDDPRDHPDQAVPERRPITVANFEKLVKKGFYNGLTFHRITDLGDPGASKIVQGGDPPATARAAPATRSRASSQTNGVNNPLTHVAGAVAMARSGDPTPPARSSTSASTRSISWTANMPSSAGHQRTGRGGQAANRRQDDQSDDGEVAAERRPDRHRKRMP